MPPAVAPSSTPTFLRCDLTQKARKMVQAIVQEAVAVRGATRQSIADGVKKMLDATLTPAWVVVIGVDFESHARIIKNTCALMTLGSGQDRLLMFKCAPDLEEVSIPVSPTPSTASTDNSPHLPKSVKIVASLSADNNDRVQAVLSQHHVSGDNSLPVQAIATIKKTLTEQFGSTWHAISCEFTSDSVIAADVTGNHMYTIKWGKRKMFLFQAMAYENVKSAASKGEARYWLYYIGFVLFILWWHFRRSCNADCLPDAEHPEQCPSTQARMEAEACSQWASYWFIAALSTIALIPAVRLWNRLMPST